MTFRTPQQVAERAPMAQAAYLHRFFEQLLLARWDTVQPAERQAVIVSHTDIAKATDLPVYVIQAHLPTIIEALEEAGWHVTTGPGEVLIKVKTDDDT